MTTSSALPRSALSRSARPAPRGDAKWLLFSGGLFFTFAAHIAYIFFRTPTAQAEAGGLAQKIFYFHVPAAYALYLAGAVCFFASAAYILKPSLIKNAWAQAGAEVAVVFGLMVLVSGPLWAKKAWGVYWTWDPRLTSLLLAVLLYGAMVLFRRFVGDGDAERRFAAALGVLGTALLPVVHYSVRLWGGNHPTVITKGGGGLSSLEMRTALLCGFVTMTGLAFALLATRARAAVLESRFREAEALLFSLEDQELEP